MENIRVFSEIGKLRKVLLHYPTEELNNLTPKYLEDLLFDDIPWLPLAQKEHNTFAKVFIDNNVEVVYLEDLISEVLNYSNQIKEEFINEFIEEANINSETLTRITKDYLMNIKDTKVLVNKCISGIKKEELPNYKKRTLTDFIVTNPFVINPMPNLYFTRDPFACIGNGVSLNKMYYLTRRRETIFGKYIFKYHKDYKDTKLYYNRDYKCNIEGGDICVLNSKTLIIGASQRTSTQGIETLAKSLFFKNDSSYETILVFTIPNQRTFMHLDTIFTQVDYDKFAIHKGCYETLQVFEITKGSNNKLKTTKLNGKLEDILEKYIGKKITLIPCGGNDSVSADREQWSDGSNCVCLEPGVVIAYERNEITNKTLESYGIKVITIPSSELSRGRGGPRCMSMPLIRDNIKE